MDEVGMCQLGSTQIHTQDHSQWKGGEKRGRATAQVLLCHCVLEQDWLECDHFKFHSALPAIFINRKIDYNSFYA